MGSASAVAAVELFFRLFFASSLAIFEHSCYNIELSETLRGRAEVARQAHNLEASGSIPLPATN